MSFIDLSLFFMIFLCLFLQNKPHLVEPIDFESFVSKNKTLLQNDPQRELLLYPQDDISVSYYSCISYQYIYTSVSFVDKLTKLK